MFADSISDPSSVHWLIVARELRGHCRRNRLIGRASMLSNDGMAICGFLGIFVAQKVLGSLSDVSRDSTKRMKIIPKQENNFWKDCKKRYSPIKLLKDNFE